MAAAPAAPAYVPKTCDTSAAALQKQTLTVNGVTREYLEVAPSNITALVAKNVRNVPVVVSYHDAAQDGQKGAAATCWNEVASANGGVAIFPTAVGGNWNTRLEAGAADDVAFTRAVIAAVLAKYGLPGNEQLFVTGVGQGAAMASVMAMASGQLGANSRPTNYVAALATVNGSADPAVFSTSFAPTTLAAWSIKQPGYTGSDAQQIVYWMQQNGITAPAVGTSDAKFQSVVYTNPSYPAQQAITSTTVTPNYAGKDLSQDIWDRWFTKKVKVSDDTRTNGTVRDFLGVAQMGLLDVTKTLSTGVSRRYLVYLPKNYAALTAGGKKLPLVFSLHGRNGAAEFIALTSRWWEVAEKNGFIAVFPQGLNNTWNTGISASNPDVADMLALINQLKADYAVDANRIYMNGQSMGAAFTNRMAVQYPNLFAAVAPCYSGHLGASAYADAIVRTDVPLPVWQCRGQDEITSDFPGSEPAARQFWRVTVNKHLGNPVLQVDGRNATEIYTDGVAEYRWQVRQYQPHFEFEGQSQKLWDEFFKRFARDASGNLVTLP
ncbi:PHB depolymerase family esterase [Piscinibacter sakaiensis]|uniref:PHB depolymerase family esterase n=1 Tax=Piscinibacter sakaiensis TaxID=1547922 RepID=UPI00372C79E0